MPRIIKYHYGSIYFFDVAWFCEVLLVLSGIIIYLQVSLSIIKYHWVSSSIIKHHWVSWSIIEYHQLSLSIIKYHWVLSSIIEYRLVLSCIIKYCKASWSSSSLWWFPSASLSCYHIVSIRHHLVPSQKVFSKKLLILKFQSLVVNMMSYFQMSPTLSTSNGLYKTKIKIKKICSNRRIVSEKWTNPRAYTIKRFYQ